MRRITKDAAYMRKRRKSLCEIKGLCSTCFLYKAAKEKKSCQKCLVHDRKRTRRRTQIARKRTLSHYGKGGKLMCCARGCQVSNINMLTLDHVNDNGLEERKETGRLGWFFYEWLRSKGYPEGYQTLCANHQLLKEFMRRKRNWL